MTGIIDEKMKKMIRITNQNTKFVIPVQTGIQKTESSLRAFSPLQAGIQTLINESSLRAFSPVCMFVIPVYMLVIPVQTGIQKTENSLRAFSPLYAGIQKTESSLRAFSPLYAGIHSYKKEVL